MVEPLEKIIRYCIQKICGFQKIQLNPWFGIRWSIILFYFFSCGIKEVHEVSFEWYAKKLQYFSLLSFRMGWLSVQILFVELDFLVLNLNLKQPSFIPYDSDKCSRMQIVNKASTETYWVFFLVVKSRQTSAW